jgi:hypothetical protein
LAGASASIAGAVAAGRPAHPRAKKEALIAGNFRMIEQLAQRRTPFSPSFETAAAQPPQDEENGYGANGARGN